MGFAPGREWRVGITDLMLGTIHNGGR